MIQPKVAIYDFTTYRVIVNCVFGALGELVQLRLELDLSLATGVMLPNQKNTMLSF